MNMKFFSLSGVIISTVLLATWGASYSDAWGQEPTLLQRPGVNGEKYRILVDKVFWRTNYPEDMHLHEKEFKQIAKCGFNVLCPRFYANDEEQVVRRAPMAAKEGLYYMGWIRPSLPPDYDARIGMGFDQPKSKDELRKQFGPPLLIVFESGETTNLLSPNSDELWYYVEEVVMMYVRNSLKYKNIIGMFLDFEFYAHPKPKKWYGHLYTVSYDDKIMGEFFKSKGLEMPELKPEQRYPYLKTNELDKEFSDFQVESWRQRMRSLRKKVDQINPTFQFAIYPSSYTLFVNEAAWELATEKAPLILAEHETYGRGFPKRGNGVVSGYFRISDAEGAAMNAQFVASRKARYQTRKKPFAVLGGIDPIVFGGEDPQFQAMSMVAMSKAGDGYWIFYEGFRPDTYLHDYFQIWFELANDAISKRHFDLDKAVRRK